MTAQDWLQLKKDAQKLLNDLDLSNLSKNGFITLGACVAILDHQIPCENYLNAQPQIAAQITPEPLAIEKLKELVTKEIESADFYFSIGEIDFTNDNVRHATYWLSKLKAQAITQENKTFVRDMWTHLSLIKQRVE